MPSFDGPPPHSSHARTRERASSSSSMPSSAYSAPPSNFLPLTTTFHTPQPHSPYYQCAIQNREKLREELHLDSNRLGLLLQRLEGQPSKSQGVLTEEMDGLWLEVYKILFMIRSNLRRPSTSVAEDAIQHWSEYTHLFERLARIKGITPTTRNFQEDIPTTVCRMAGILSHLFTHGSLSVTQRSGREQN